MIAEQNASAAPKSAPEPSSEICVGLTMMIVPPRASASGSSTRLSNGVREYQRAQHSDEDRPEVAEKDGDGHIREPDGREEEHPVECQQRTHPHESEFRAAREVEDLVEAPREDEVAGENQSREEHAPEHDDEGACVHGAHENRVSNPRWWPLSRPSRGLPGSGPARRSRQQIRGSCSPTSMSMIRLAPKPVWT